MNKIDNPLSEHQSPPEEALINFGVDVSKEAVEKCFGKVWQTATKPH